MKSKRRIIGILAAVILATIGTVALVGYVQSAKDKAVAPERMVEIYVVDKLVPKGASAESIKSSVSVEQVPARLQQPGAITDLKDLGANVAGTDLLPGDQLLAGRLVSKEQVAVEVKDKVQISEQFTAEQAVGGILRKGDLVGIYLSFDEFPDQGLDGAAAAADGTAATAATATTGSTTPSADQSRPEVTHLEFQHVLVTNVQTPDDPMVTADTDSAQQGQEQLHGSNYIVTLALSPEQSERFVFAAEFGRLWLSNMPATVSDDGTRLVTIGNVFAVVK